mmetsp:Transcript_30474/g.45078  ORF Transcript_30474/g.45078 Transcript_30474/m.45078 type:complete len:200 (+) Transcript_30474:376-975(+)
MRKASNANRNTSPDSCSSAAHFAHTDSILSLSVRPSAALSSSWVSARDVACLSRPTSLVSPLSRDFGASISIAWWMIAGTWSWAKQTVGRGPTVPFVHLSVSMLRRSLAKATASASVSFSIPSDAATSSLGSQPISRSNTARTLSAQDGQNLWIARCISRAFSSSAPGTVTTTSRCSGPILSHACSHCKAGATPLRFDA